MKFWCIGTFEVAIEFEAADAEEAKKIGLAMELDPKKAEYMGTRIVNDQGEEEVDW
jgi:hypothetical protein